jgi:ankyrin repeat protein
MFLVQEDGLTALDVAVFNGQLECASVLLLKGASLASNSEVSLAVVVLFK